MHYRTLSLTLTLLLAGLAGCKSSTMSAQIIDVEPPRIASPGYRIVGKVEGSGQDSAFCPGVMEVFLGKSTVGRAREEAVGRAIYENDAVDMIIAPKTKTEYFNVLGIYDSATVHIKGKGVELQSGAK